jgi:hypothetical protein
LIILLIIIILGQTSIIGFLSYNLIETKKLLENERVLNDLKVLEGDKEKTFTNFYDYSNTFENEKNKE